jgi:hypothetical protein
MDKMTNIVIGDFKFHLFSLKTDTGSVRGIEITDAFAGIEEIGFIKKLSIPFTDPHLIDDEKFKQENHNNIEGLKKLCEFILNEIK